MNVGLIGVGHMGRAMGARLLSLGHELVVYNRTRSKAEPLGREGARIAATPADAARDVEVLITMLADDEAVTAAVLGESGAIRALGKNCVHLGMSTVSPALSRRLARAHAEVGQLYVAAPVMGRPEAASAGALAIIAAGPRQALERCQPAFDSLGKETHTVGDVPEQANVIKLAANFFLATILETLG